MKKLKTIIIDIRKLNINDDLDEFIKNMPFLVVNGISEYLKEIDTNYTKGDNTAFLITDNREAADLAIEYGIGISVYTNDENSPFDFTEALYCIDNIAQMTEKTLERMYLRAENLPWEILRTNNLLVREVTLEDIDRLYEIYSDEDVVRYIENLYETKEEEIIYTKDYIINQYRFYEYGMWIVEEIDSKKIIGRAGIFDRPNQDSQEMGFVFDKSYWGKGYAYECLNAIINYAHEELGIENLLAHAISENERSIKLLNKLGFYYECEAIIDDKKYNRYKYSSYYAV